MGCTSPPSVPSKRKERSNKCITGLLLFQFLRICSGLGRFLCSLLLLNCLLIRGHACACGVCVSKRWKKKYRRSLFLVKRCLLIFLRTLRFAAASPIAPAVLPVRPAIPAAPPPPTPSLPAFSAFFALAAALFCALPPPIVDLCAVHPCVRRVVQIYFPIELGMHVVRLGGWEWIQGGRKKKRKQKRKITHIDCFGSRKRSDSQEETCPHDVCEDI